MYFTSSAEDPEFREAAEAILLRAEDMIPRYGQSVWALSLQKVESTPEIKKLYKQFEEKKLGAIVERRRSDQPAKVVKKRHGPDIVFSYGDLPPVEEGQFLVAISIEKPKVSSSTPGKAAAADGTVTRNGTLAEGSKNLSSDDSTIQSHQKTLRDNVRVCAAVNEVQKIQRTDYDSIPDTIKALPTTLTSLQRFIEMLKQEAEIVVSTSSIDYDGKPLKWDVGDILELDATEAANPKNGVSGGFFILYNWL